LAQSGQLRAAAIAAGYGGSFIVVASPMAYRNGDDSAARLSKIEEASAQILK